MKFLTHLFLLCGFIAEISSSKILLISVFPGQSHWLTFEHIIRELLSNGHEITAITNYKLKDNNFPDKYNEVLIEPMFDFEVGAGLPMKDFFISTTTFSDPFHKVFILWSLGISTSRLAFETKNVQTFLKANNLTFDLVISEQFFQESFLMFAHKYNAPLLTINTLGYTDYIDRAMGLITPYSFVPHYMMEYSDEMNFIERSYNILISVTDMLLRKFYYLPAQQQVAKEYFPDLELPSIESLEKNVSVTLVNSHIIATAPRPKLMGMVDIAGVHIRPPKPLTPDMQTFFNGAEKGVIYINFGTFMRSSEMPEETLKIFLEVFRNLPQYRFLWKWENDQIPNIPNNVIVQKWIAQNDVLAHPKIKVFITHGGIFGTQEAIYHAKPMIFVPFYGDQHSNALKFEKARIGLQLTISNVTEEEFTSKILSVAEDQIFKNNINKMSQIFKDNPTDPLKESVFWIEYVLRYNGAPHIKSAAVHIPWYQYLLLDVCLLWFILITLTLYAFVRLIKKTFEICLNSKQNFKEKTL